MVEALPYPSVFRWAAVAAVAASLALITFALRAPRRPGTLVFALACAAISLAWSPQVLTHTLKIHDGHIVTWTDGYWWAPSQRRLDVRQVDCVNETTRDSGRSTTRVWVAKLRDGTVQRIVFGDLLNAHANRLRTLFNAYSVPPCRT